MRSLLVYQIESVWQFCVDNNFTPYILIDTTQEGVQVPVSYIKDGEITLNISPTAVQNLYFGDEYINFNARFNGKSMEIYFPIESVISLYAKETLEGVIFGHNYENWDDPPQIKARSPKELNAIKTPKHNKKEDKTKRNPNHLQTVKSKEDENTINKEENVVSLDSFRSKKKNKDK